jgi:formylmethanofuran dehydrogenase subunit E
MTVEDTLLMADFKRCIDFHGHVCPGVAIGFQAARLLMKRLGVERASDEELVAFVENDACGTDAIQVMTGCTFGKGNFVFRNYGKHAFILAARKLGKAVRVSLRPEMLEPDREHVSLLEKAHEGRATEGETERFNRLHYERAQKILETDPEDLFRAEEISADIPAKARIAKSGPCDICGEHTKIDLLREIDGRRLCPPCAQEQVFGTEL